MAYDAGSAFLQIIPSFRDIEGALKDGARRIGRSISDSVSDALPKGVAEGARKAEVEAEKAGRGTGQRFGGAFIREVKESARKAAAELPDIKLRADPDELDRTLERIRVELAEIGDADVNVDLDVEGAYTKLVILRNELRALQAQANDRLVLAFDADKASAALRNVDGLLDDIDRRGFEAWGKFSKGFNEAAKQSKLALPEFDPTDEQTRELAALRRELEHQAAIKLNVDIDEDSALAQMRETLGRLDTLAKDGRTRQLREDAGSSAQILRSFLGDEREAEKAGEETAKVYGGAFAVELRKILTETSAAIGEVDVDVDVNPGPAQIRLAALRAELGDLNGLIDLGLDPRLVLARLQEIKGEIRELQRVAGDDIALNFDTEKAAQALEKADALEQAARRAGLKAGGAFDTVFTARMKAAFDKLPEIEIDINTTEMDRRIAAVKARLAEIKDLRIGVDIDEDGVRRAVYAIDRELEDIANNAVTIKARFDAEQARKELTAFAAEAKTLQEQVDEAHDQALGEESARNKARQEGEGSRSAGAFADGFRKTLQDAQKDLPELDINADSSRVDKAVTDIRRRLKELSDQRIGIDISAEEAEKKLSALDRRLQAIANDKSLDIQVRVDAATALARLRKFYDEGGDGASKLQARLRAALRDLPQIRPDVETGESERKLEVLRAALARVQKQNIDLELDDAQAEAKIKQISAELAKLASESPNIQVRVDAARAIAQLKDVQREADQADRAVSGVGSSAGGGIGRLAALVLAGASLGTIVVPAAAAAAVAIAGIGAAAGVAVAGVGVIALSLFGIGDAVKALNKADEDQAKTAKSLGASNKALATARDQLTNAELNQSDARADAAQAARDSEQRLQQARETASDNNVKASRDLKDAQDAEKESRLALNEAIKDARQDMAELNLQVQKNSLDQRQATSAIAVEKMKLDAVLANPRSSQLERDQARQTYDERVLQLKELQLKGKELDRDQKDYAKNGVEASDKVKTARKREKTAVRAVSDAEKNRDKVRTDGARSVRDAEEARTRQQRSSERALRTAQQQIITAQRNVTQAIVGSASAGGSALDNLNTALAKLSPTGQDFAKYIFSLKDDFKSLTDASQRGFLPGLKASIEEIRKYLEPFRIFVERVGVAMGNLFLDFAKSLDKPVWKKFFGYFSATAVPTMQNLFDITENIAEGVANLFLAMAPFNAGFLSGLVNATKKFADFGEKLTNSAGYVDFLEYVDRVGPKVVDLIKNMATFIGKIVIAAAPIGEKIVDDFNELFTWLNSISTVRYTDLLDLLVKFAGAALLIGGVSGAFRFLSKIVSPIITVFGKLAGAVGGIYTTAVQNATIATGELSGKQKVAAGTSGLFRTAITKTTVAFGLALIAVALLAGAYFDYTSKQEESASRINDLADGITQLGAAYKATGNLASDEVQDVVKQNTALRDLALDTDKYGISLSNIAEAAKGNRTAQDLVTKAYEDQIKALDDRQKKQQLTDSQDTPNFSNPFDLDSYKKLNPFRESDADKITKEKDALIEQRDAMKQSWVETERATNASKLLNEQKRISAEILRIDAIPKTLEENAALQANQDEIGRLTTIVNNNATAQGRAANAATFFKDELEKQTGVASRAQDANEDFASGLINLKTQVDGATTAHDKNAKSLEFNSEHLEKNSASAIANRNSIEDLAAKSRDAFLTDIEAGVGIDTARKAHDKRIESLKKEAAALGLDKGQVDELIKSQGDISDVVTTDYKTTNFVKAYEELQRLNFMQEMVRQGKDASTAEAEYQKYKSNLDAQTVTDSGHDLKTRGRAYGGPIYGPGTKTSDDVPIWASRGEFMQRAAAVDYYGTDFMHAVNQLMIPKDLARYAKGGMIDNRAQKLAKGGRVKKELTAPILVDFGDMDIAKPTKAEARRTVTDQLGALNLSGGVVTGSLELARIAESTARNMNASSKQLLALFEAGLVESGLRNLNYGDRDSLGFLQQRASWGTAAQRMSPAYATKAFINKAKRVDRTSYSAGQLAQAVQISAFPDRYDKRAADAAAVINRESPYLSGYGSSLGAAKGGRGWKWQINALRSVFPGLALNSGYRNTRTSSGALSWHGRDGGRAIDVPPRRDVGQYIYDTYGKNTIELITPFRELNLKDGKPHRYSAAVEAQHGVGSAGNDHVHWAYDQGGWLPPGYHSVVNATGKPEAVFTNSQFQDIRSLADATRASVTTNSTGNGATYQFEFGNSTLDAARMASIQQRADSLARINRTNY